MARSDLAVQIMGANPPPGSTYDVGEIIAVYPAEQVGKWNGTEYIMDDRARHTVVVFLREVPVDSPRKFRIGGETGFLDADGNEYDDSDPLKRRKAWRLRRSDLPLPQRRALFNDADDNIPGVGYVTLGWGVARDMFRHIRKDRPAKDTDLDTSEGLKRVRSAPRGSPIPFLERPRSADDR